MRTNSQINLGLKDLMVILLQTQMDYKWFEVRKHLNEESALFLPKSKEFKADLAVFLKEFDVPKLNIGEDYTVIHTSEYEIEDSTWLGGHSNEFINRWETGIKKLLNKHHLPESFRDWVEFNILYGKSKYYPHYNVETILTIIIHPEEAKRIGLTTQEKEFMLYVLRSAVESTKGKRRSALRKSYVILKEVIAKSKNTKRRLRTLKTALKTLDIGKKETYYDYSVGEKVIHKTTSADLATTIFKDETGKKDVLVRKQKERLLKRHI